MKEHVDLPPLVLKGIQEFNRGEYFEQHETLEAAWRAEPGRVRQLYQGILQIGVACYHIESRNRPGAQKLLERGLEHLRPFAPECQGIDVARLIADAERLRNAIAHGETDAMENLGRALFPKIVRRKV